MWFIPKYTLQWFSRDESLVSRDESLVSRDESLVSRDGTLVSREMRREVVTYFWAVLYMKNKEIESNWNVKTTRVWYIFWSTKNTLALYAYMRIIRVCAVNVYLSGTVGIAMRSKLLFQMIKSLVVTRKKSLKFAGVRYIFQSMILFSRPLLKIRLSFM